MAAKKAKVKRLLRSGNNRIIGGVCGGIGEYVKNNPALKCGACF